MRDRLIEVVDKSKEEYANDVTDHTETEYIVEGLLNKGAILPPCKVGDTAYTILRGKIFCYTVLEYSVRGKCGSVYAENDRDFLDFPFAELGKTVFLTREEAEQALKGDQT